MGEGSTNETTPGRPPVPWLPIIAVIVVAAPVLEAVRSATEPDVGDWGAFGLGVLAASVVGLLVLAAANWIVRREQRGRPDDPAAMVYRPAIFPLWVFAGALLKNLPSALTEWVAGAYLGWLVVLLACVVQLQRRRGQAWSWWVAIPIGFGVALAAWLGAMGVAQVVAPHEVRPG